MDINYSGKSSEKLLGIGIPYLLINLLSCHGFIKNINFTVILLYPSQMLEDYFSKRFVFLERNSNNLKIITNEAKKSLMKWICMIQTMF